MKKYKILLIALVSLQFTFAQINVKGKVIDQQGTPVFGVNISYKNIGETSNHGGTITEKNGNFSLELPQSGTYQLKLNYIGMKPQSFESLFDEEKEYNLGTLVLEENIQQLQSVY